MPFSVVEDHRACPASRPWAVKNTDTGDVGGRCHATRDDALSQQRALMANVPDAGGSSASSGIRRAAAATPAARRRAGL